MKTLPKLAGTVPAFRLAVSRSSAPISETWLLFGCENSVIAFDAKLEDGRMDELISCEKSRDIASDNMLGLSWMSELMSQLHDDTMKSALPGLPALEVNGIEQLPSPREDIGGIKMPSVVPGRSTIDSCTPAYELNLKLTRDVPDANEKLDDRTSSMPEGLNISDFWKPAAVGGIGAGLYLLLYLGLERRKDSKPAVEGDTRSSGSRRAERPAGKPAESLAELYGELERWRLPAGRSKPAEPLAEIERSESKETRDGGLDLTELRRASDLTREKLPRRLKGALPDEYSSDVKDVMESVLEANREKWSRGTVNEVELLIGNYAGQKEGSVSKVKEFIAFSDSSRNSVPPRTFPQGRLKPDSVGESSLPAPPDARAKPALTAEKPRVPDTGSAVRSKTTPMIDAGSANEQSTKLREINPIVLGPVTVSKLQGMFRKIEIEVELLREQAGTHARIAADAQREAARLGNKTDEESKRAASGLEEMHRSHQKVADDCHRLAEELKRMKREHDSLPSQAEREVYCKTIAKAVNLAVKNNLTTVVPGPNNSAERLAPIERTTMRSQGQSALEEANEFESKLVAHKTGEQHRTPDLDARSKLPLLSPETAADLHGARRVKANLIDELTAVNLEQKLANSGPEIETHKEKARILQQLASELDEKAGKLQGEYSRWFEHARLLSELKAGLPPEISKSTAHVAALNAAIELATRRGRDDSVTAEEIERSRQDMRKMAAEHIFIADELRRMSSERDSLTSSTEREAFTRKLVAKIREARAEGHDRPEAAKKGLGVAGKAGTAVALLMVAGWLLESTAQRRAESIYSGRVMPAKR